MAALFRFVAGWLFGWLFALAVWLFSRSAYCPEWALSLAGPAGVPFLWPAPRLRNRARIPLTLCIAAALYSLDPVALMVASPLLAAKGACYSNRFDTYWAWRCKQQRLKGLRP